jgi:hypothetical protein
MGYLNKQKSLSQIIDRIEQMREELGTIQRALERRESAEDSARSDGERNLKSTVARYQLKISL